MSRWVFAKSQRKRAGPCLPPLSRTQRQYFLSLVDELKLRTGPEIKDKFFDSRKTPCDWIPVQIMEKLAQGTYLVAEAIIVVSATEG